MSTYTEPATCPPLNGSNVIVYDFAAGVTYARWLGDPWLRCNGN